LQFAVVLLVDAPAKDDGHLVGSADINNVKKNYDINMGVENLPPLRKKLH
jgi:hypothetical protein